MEEIVLWRGVRRKDGLGTQCVRFRGELLGVVDVGRSYDWVEGCLLYRAENGSIVVHRKRLSLCDDGVDVAEVYTLPALDADAGWREQR